MILRSCRFRGATSVRSAASFPPLAKGGLGGVVPAKPIMVLSEIRRVPISLLLAPSWRRRRITKSVQGTRLHPPWPPLRKGGKGKAPASPNCNPANKNDLSATILSATLTPTFHRPGSIVRPGSLAAKGWLIRPNNTTFLANTAHQERVPEGIMSLNFGRPLRWPPRNHHVECQRQTVGRVPEFNNNNQ